MRRMRLVIFLFALMGFSQSMHGVNTMVNEEIDPVLRNEMGSIFVKFIQCMKDKNLNVLEELISPKLMELEKFDLNSFMEQVSP